MKKLLLLLILLSMLLLSSCYSHPDYDELKEKYDPLAYECEELLSRVGYAYGIKIEDTEDLSERLSIVRDQIGALEDDVATVFCYFDNDDTITFDEAKESFDRIDRFFLASFIKEHNMIFGYCRVSSDEQATHGISIDAQKDILSGYAAMSQSPIRIFEDAGFSGKNMDRPALRQLLTAVRSGKASAVVVWKLDRLSRSLRDTLQMIEDIFAPAGVTLVSVTESIDTSTPSGRMMLNLLASFAQLEREQDSDRVVMSHKHLAHDCKYLGGHVPLGYCIDAEKHYHLDPVSAPIARRVFEMYLSRSGYSDILSYLNSPEIFPSCRRNKPYTKQDLNYLLKNEIYAGTYLRRIGADPRHKVTSPETIRIPGGVPAILSPEEWIRVCTIRQQNKDHLYWFSYSAKRVYPLSGLVHCATCGRTMSVRHGGKTRAGEVERYYRCPSGCVRPARLESVEQAVFNSIAYMAADPALVSRACAVANTFSDQDDHENFAAVSPLEDRIQEIRRQSARLIRYVKEHDNAPGSMMDELVALEKEETLLRTRIENLRRPRGRYDADSMLQLLRASAGIKELPPDVQKQHIQATIHKVIVSDTTHQILFVCPMCSGDEPSHHMEHIVPRK